MSYKNVRIVLETALNAFSITNSIPIAWENIDFDKNTTNEFIEVFLLTSDPDENFLAGGNRLLGVLQLNIHTEKNIGNGRVREIVDLLESYFQDEKFVNTTIGYAVSIDDIYLPRVQGSRASASNVENNKFVQLMAINWQAWRA